MPEDHSPPASKANLQLTRYAFVYGTLRRGDDNDMNRLQPAPQFVGNASIAGVMYHFQAYPGVILGGDRQVVGEVYAITPALERQLDEIEELYPQQKDEYAKREIPVLVNGVTLTCIVYEINPQYVVGKPVIASGDWVKDR
jgi:gamma-glutamylcyclotransferase (GGCT)/AIG2-like uncharacterized protein YtfP